MRKLESLAGVAKESIWRLENDHAKSRAITKLAIDSALKSVEFHGSFEAAMAAKEQARERRRRDPFGFGNRGGAPA